MTEEKILICSHCKKKPPREGITFGEVATDTHFCAECWAEKLKILRSGDIEKQAQAQFDKLMRDMRNGVDPSEAWKNKAETDD